LSNTLEITLPELHRAQQTIKDEARRFNVLRCGRRFGKNIVGHELVIDTALAGLPAAWCAPSYPEVAEDWRDIYGKVFQVIVNSDKTEKRIELITGGSIKMWSLDGKQSMRGNKYARVVINEAAKIPQLETDWNEVIRATLADLKGDAWFLSTPRGFNFFHTLYKRHEDDPTWAGWHFTTYDNPYIDRAEIADLKRTLPERVFSQEIMAEFLPDGSYFQNIDAAAVITEPDKPDRHTGHHVVMGVDWAKSADFTVLTVGCRDCNRVVDWQRFNQIDYHYQRGRLADMAKRWSIGAILAESNSIGEPNIEELQRAGLPVQGFTTTAASKADMIEALHLALVNDGLKVPTDYADELRAFEIEIRAGAPKFGAPSGLHDDRVISLALCNRAMTHGSVTTFANPFYN
jgi:hypothetical protein